MTTPSILILPGDGIGPEVMAEVVKVIDWFGDKRGLKFDVSHDLVGGAAYDKHGAPISDETMEKAQSVDAVLLGAVGGPKYDDLDFAVKPERGLLRLRKEMDLFANLRPAQCFDALADFSSLKKDIVAGLDIMIVRELTSGIYFGERYTESESERAARAAFELAMKRDKRLCSMEKANVMESGILWRDVVNEVAVDYPEVEVSHMYADNGAMQLVRAPKQTSLAKARPTQSPVCSRSRWRCATRLIKATKRRVWKARLKPFWQAAHAPLICWAKKV